MRFRPPTNFVLASLRRSERRELLFRPPTNFVLASLRRSERRELIIIVASQEGSQQ